AEFPDSRLELPGVKRPGQLRQVAGDAEILRIERTQRSSPGHVGYRAVLADRHQDSPRSKASRIRAASARSCGRTVSFFIRYSILGLATRTARSPSFTSSDPTNRSSQLKASPSRVRMSIEKRPWGGVYSTAG